MFSRATCCVSNGNKSSCYVVCKEIVWKRLYTERTVQPKQHGVGNPSNLTQGDLQLIETWKKARPTSSSRKIHNVVNRIWRHSEWNFDFRDFAFATQEHVVRFEIHEKKNRTVDQERFTIENMAYAQMFIDYLHTKNPHKLPFALNLPIFDIF